MYVEIPSTLLVDVGVLLSRWTFLASVHAHEKEVFKAFDRGINAGKKSSAFYLLLIMAWLRRRG